MKTADNHLDISVTSGTLFRLLGIVLAVIFLYLVIDVLVIILFSIVIASGVGPLAGWLQKRGWPRTLAVFLIYLAAFAALALVLYAIVSPLGEEFNNLSLIVPIYFDKISSAFEQIRDTAPKYESLLNTAQNYLDEFSNDLNDLAGNIFGTVSKIFGGVVSTIVVIVISFYLSAQEHGLPLFIRSVTPPEHQSYVLNLWARAQHKLGRWLQAQVILSLSVAVLVFLGLSIFGIQHKILLSLWAAIMELVPFIGPILAAVPAVLLGLLKSPVVALWTVITYTIIHQLESHVLVPNVMQRVVSLNPVVSIVALLIGGKLLGLPGIILGVPVAVVVVEFIKDFGHRHDKSADLAEPIRP